MIDVVGECDLTQRFASGHAPQIAAADLSRSPHTPGLGSLRQSSKAETVEQPCHRPAMPTATTRRGDLPPGQLVGDLLDRQVAKLDQDWPQRLCISIGFALVLLRLLGIAQKVCEMGRKARGRP